MEIGFVSFNQEALNRANKVMKLLQGQGAVDELGLGRIRDAFSNMMFPGMSVLQTRAKYFLLMPALYAHLERTRIADTREARKTVRDNEIKLTNRLIEGSAKNASGIIGADMLRRNEGYVKYDPSYVYQAGMETYGLIPRGSNVYATLVERSAINLVSPRKHKSNDNDTADDSDDLAGNRQAFITCGINYKFGQHDPIDIALNRQEADFLKNRIITHTRGSLLSYLLDSGLYEKVNDYRFDELQEVFKDNLPQDLFHTYRLALRYSRFACLLRVRFAMLYDTAVGATRSAHDELSRFNQMLTEHADQFKPEAIREIISFISLKITEESCKSFILKSAGLIADGNFEKLDRQITLREKTLKGAKRSKLFNAREMPQGKPLESPEMMTYRWNIIVSSVLTEIKEGLKNE